MDNILYTNSVTDVRLKEMVEIIPGKDKELSNQIILTIQSAGAGEITPIFLKASRQVSFTSIDEIGTKFILDDKEVTTDVFQVTTGNTTYFGLQFEDSNEHTLKVSLVNSSINQSIFGNIQYLTKVTIGTSIISIGDAAFNHCYSLTSVTIGNSVTTIGSSAFDGCTGLKSIIIPNSVTEIGSQAFNDCNSLTTITSLAATTPTISNNTFYNIKSGGTLHVPAGSDYSAWMSTDSHYLGEYNWTKVEDA